jgi:hypothetical protein
MQEPLSVPVFSTLSPNCIAQSLQNLHVEKTCNILSKRHEIMVHIAVDVKGIPGTF